MPDLPARLVLDGVPRVGFYTGGPRCPEDIMLPAVMRSLLEYLGEADYGCRHCPTPAAGVPAISCAYAFLTGVSGAAAHLSWKRGWHTDNLALSYLPGEPGSAERAICDAVGYAHEWVTRDGGAGEDEFRRRIRESIAAGRPVLGYGVVGPAEPALITGYDEGGAVLVGWSFFQDMPPFNAGLDFEPTGEFRKRDWFAETDRLLLIGAKHTRPPLGQVYRAALRRLIEVTRTPLADPRDDAPEPRRDRANGLAAYDAWAEHLLSDEDFPRDDEATLRTRHEVHDGAIGSLAEARWYGSRFLLGMTDHTDTHVHRDMIEDLLYAAALYAGEHELMWRLWDLAGGIGSPRAHLALADRAVRQEMAAIVRRARTKEAAAVTHLEHALAKLPEVPK